MTRWLLERKLAQVRSRLRAARDELAVLEEQFVQFSDTADETGMQALVSGRPDDQLEYGDARRHAEAMSRSRDHLRRQVAELERAQDDLLDRLALRHR